MRFALSLVAALGLAPLVCAQDAPAPRRMLFVHVGGYPYLNPLTSAAPGGPDRARDAAERLAAGFRVPTAKGNDQLFVLADTLGSDAPLPTKDALAKAVEGFCATTREQDRVVLYFALHAVEKDGKAYLAPLDGTLEDLDTLLPLEAVYAQLDKLKAAQKVVIWDVCRHNPDRLRARRDAGPMTAPLLKALTGAPDGVQVLVSCSAGEKGLEYGAPRGPAAMFAGSAYLDALRQAAADTRTEPADAIPVAELHKLAGKTVAGLSKQTPATAGDAPKSAAAFDPKAAPAKRFEWAAPPKGAPAAEVKAIFDELALPALVDDDPAVLARLPFSADALKGYAADVAPEEVLKNADKYPLRVATLRAAQAVREGWPLGPKEMKGVTALAAPVTERAKKPFGDAQEPLALALVRLELELETLLAAAPHRAKETKRWQAHYDLAVAELRLRLVAINEYNLLLARVRTETLPDLADGAPGWRLAPAPTLQSRREAKKMLEEAQSGFEDIARTHKGTPWAALAHRARAFEPGLRWEALPPPPKPDGK